MKSEWDSVVPWPSPENNIQGFVFVPRGLRVREEESSPVVPCHRRAGLANHPGPAPGGPEWRGGVPRVRRSVPPPEAPGLRHDFDFNTEII